MVIVHALWTLQLLVSTALLAKILATYEKEGDFGFGNKQSVCDQFDKADKDYQCRELIGGVVRIVYYL
jgi:hypothetical protein